MDNATDWRSRFFDPKEVSSGDKKEQHEIMFSFAMVTVKGEEGDLQLAQLCVQLNACGLFHHTYDAKVRQEAQVGGREGRREGIAGRKEAQEGAKEARTQ